MTNSTIDAATSPTIGGQAMIRLSASGSGAPGTAPCNWCK